MRRTLTALAATAALAVGGGLVLAGPAAAAPSERSVHTFCNLPTDTHPGKHAGWFKETSGERRNLGGNCGPVG